MLLKLNSKIKFRDDNKIREGYVVGVYKYGKIQISENEVSKQNGFEKYWLIYEKDVIEEL